MRLVIRSLFAVAHLGGRAFLPGCLAAAGAWAGDAMYSFLTYDVDDQVAHWLIPLETRHHYTAGGQGGSHLPGISNGICTEGHASTAGVFLQQARSEEMPESAPFSCTPHAGLQVRYICVYSV